jgi:Protein of unknown function (DUF2510)
VTASPEGWYPDPSGTAWVRYWSGTEWTAWVSVNGTVANDGRGAQTPPPPAPPSRVAPPPSSSSRSADPPGMITFGGRAGQDATVAFSVDPSTGLPVGSQEPSTIVFPGVSGPGLQFTNEGFNQRGCFMAPAVLVGGGLVYIVIMAVVMAIVVVLGLLI